MLEQIKLMLICYFIMYCRYRTWYSLLSAILCILYIKSPVIPRVILGDVYIVILCLEMRHQPELKAQLSSFTTHCRSASLI